MVEIIFLNRALTPLRPLYWNITPIKIHDPKQVSNWGGEGWKGRGRARMSYEERLGGKEGHVRTVVHSCWHQRSQAELSLQGRACTGLCTAGDALTYT